MAYTKKPYKKPYKKRAVPKKGTAPSVAKIAKRVLTLEKRTKGTVTCEYLKNDFFRDMRAQTGNIYTVCLNEPAACTIPFDTIIPGNIKTDSIYMSNMGLKITFAMERNAVPNNLVTTTFVTYFILRGKPALSSRLDVNNNLVPVYNTHYTSAGDGLAGGTPAQGIIPCPMINKDLFSIVSMKRFVMGNVVYQGQGPTILSDTHREFYHKIGMKVTTKDVKDTAFTNAEADLNAKDRFYLLVITDRPTDTVTTSQPQIYVNGQCLIRSYFTSKS